MNCMQSMKQKPRAGANSSRAPIVDNLARCRALALAAYCGLAAGCSMSSGGGTSPGGNVNSGPNANINGSSATEVVQRATYLVLAYNDEASFVATSFAVGPTMLATNAHVVDDIMSIASRANGEVVVLRHETGEQRRITRVWKDPEYDPNLFDRTPDVGFLEVDVTVDEYIALPSGGEIPQVRVTDAITLCGFPGSVVQSIDLSVDLDDVRPRASCPTGTVSAIRPLDPAQPATDANSVLVQIDVSAEPGNSGSAVLADDGTVLGILSFGTSTLQTFAYRSDLLNALLDRIRQGLIPTFIVGASPGDSIVWGAAFDASEQGFLSAVWGSGPDDVFTVGGQPAACEVFHYNGSVWQEMNVPTVPVLAWVFGFGPDDVYAVGVDGGMIRYDGQTWRTIATGTTQDLWGIWGSAPNDLWIVGGDVEPTGQPQAPPIILRYNGSTFQSFQVPPGARSATSLFKVWGIGSKVFAVGSNGLILEFDGTDWVQVDAGDEADEDFVSLWGTSEDNIVAVGGRSGARIASYNGTTWSTIAPDGVPGLNAVFMVNPHEAVFAGVNGEVGRYDPILDDLQSETPATGQELHGMWGDGQGRFYAVGGRTGAVPFSGVALLRTIGDSGVISMPPEDPPDVPRMLEIGFANGGPYTVVPPGGEMPVFMGPQGGIHIFATIRGTGFAPNALVSLTQMGTLVDNGQIIITPFTANATFTQAPGEDGVNQLLDRFIFLSALPNDVYGETALLRFTITATADPTVTATIEQEVLLVPFGG